MNENDVHNIQLSIEQAKQMIKDAETVARLQKHPDFEAIVARGYFEQEAIRLVHAKSDPSMQSEEHQKRIDTDIKAIGSFGQFLGSIIQNGRMAQDAVEQHQEELERIRNEESESTEVIGGEVI